MKRFLVIIVVLSFLAVPVSAMDFSAPPAPDAAMEYLPEKTEDFGDGLRFVLKSAVSAVHPEIAEAAAVCLTLIAAVLLVSIVANISDNTKNAIQLAGTAVLAITLFRPANAFIKMGAETVKQVSQYGKILLPVLTGAMAAQGGVTKSGALYAATAFFDALLSEGIAVVLIPMVYLYLSVCVTSKLFPQPILTNLRNLMKWLISWSLKTVLYVFTGYISITGVVGGATDATMLKATKLTISGMVPVVGGVLSDASEAVLVSAGIMKNAAGVYGLLTVIALWIGPFLRIGVQYLMLKITAGICQMFGTKQMSEIINDFSGAMGFILAMTAAVCLIFIISTICFMKGVG